MRMVAVLRCLLREDRFPGETRPGNANAETRIEEDADRRAYSLLGKRGDEGSQGREATLSFEFKENQVTALSKQLVSPGPFQRIQKGRDPVIQVSRA